MKIIKFNFHLNIFYGFIVLIFILLVVHTYLQVNAKTQNNLIPVKLVKILDGDTIKIKIDENEFPVRLIGIDCYESYKNERSYKQAYFNDISIEDVISRGQKSKDYLQNLYNNSSKNVYLDFKGLDKYKRALGIIYFDQDNVNEKLKNQGGCMIYHYKN